MSQSMFPMFIVVCAVVSGLLLFYLKRVKKRKEEEKKEQRESKPPQEASSTTPSATKTILSTITKHTQIYVFLVFSGIILVAIAIAVILYDPTLLTPYILAPLLGVFAYFFTSKEKYKNWKYGVAVTVATAVAITLWIFPDVLRMVTDPLVGDWSLKEFAGADNYKLYVLAGGILFLLLLSGYAYEAIILGVILLILW